MEKIPKTKPSPEAKRPPQEIVEQLYELLQIKRSAATTTQGEFSDKLFMTTLDRQERELYAELRASLAPPRRRGKRKTAG
jgi:hypothetical protein